MHWTRSREALYDADELARARKKRGLGGYASDAPRQSMWKTQRNVAERPEGICASCRQPAELEDGKAWCNRCRDRASRTNRKVRAYERETSDPTCVRYTGPCTICGKRMDITRKRGRKPGLLVHAKCMIEAGREA